MAPDPDLTLREGRQRYFEQNGISADGGYEDDWVHIQLGPIPFRFPNTQGRVEAVRFHDLHHVVTGYGTDLTGEAEIGAWEIASGCRSYRAAVVLNLLVMAPILFVAPRRIWKAFCRGRHSRNLYGQGFDETLLNRKVGETRRQLGLDATSWPIGAADRAAFAIALAQVVGLQLVAVAVLVGLARLAYHALT